MFGDSPVKGDATCYLCVCTAAYTAAVVHPWHTAGALDYRVGTVFLNHHRRLDTTCHLFLKERNPSERKKKGDRQATDRNLCDGVCTCHSGDRSHTFQSRYNLPGCLGWHDFSSLNYLYLRTLSEKFVMLGWMPVGEDLAALMETCSQHSYVWAQAPLGQISYTQPGSEWS